jgi:hypothetical protein
MITIGDGGRFEGNLSAGNEKISRQILQGPAPRPGNGKRETHEIGESQSLKSLRVMITQRLSATRARTRHTPFFPNPPPPTARNRNRAFPYLTTAYSA